MIDEQRDEMAIICQTKELLFHRYLYYIKDRPVVSDSTYDILERMARLENIPYFMDKTGMVGYNSNNPYHEEIVTFLEKCQKPCQYLIQAWVWKSLWPEQWESHLRGVF